MAYACVYVYIDLAYLWVKFGKGYNLLNELIYQFEIPLVVLLASLSFFPRISQHSIRVLVPILPIIVLYILFDGFYNYLGRSPRPSDFQNASNIFEFSPGIALGLISIGLLVPTSIGVSIYYARKAYRPQHFKVSLLVRAGLVVVAISTLMSDAFTEYHEAKFRYTVWSPEWTIRENGRFSSFMYYANEERKNRKKLADFSQNNSGVDLHQALYPGVVVPRNIHIIVMESFIDPRLITELKFDRSILAEELIPFLNTDKDFSRIISPVYGGGTAQAEFELLTGVKALSKVNQIEFNVMKGGAINSFILKLMENNYRQLSTVASSAGFFNSQQAYLSLGLNDVAFLEDIREEKGLPDLGPLFDGDLFEQNLQQVEQALADNDRPLVNYVLGMYGHLPFTRDEQKRPDIVSVEHKDDRLRRISNQFYYRTKALADYLNKLTALDPTAIIYVTSDHLPSILTPKTTYSLDDKVNIAIFLDKGKPVDVSGKYLYEIPWLIWDALSATKIMRQFDEDKMGQLYFKALSESL